MYVGINGEDPLTNEAVASTRGLVLMVKDQPLPAFYHACCGGHTESASDLFGDYPDMPGVPCEFCRESPYYSWQVTFTDIQVRNRLLLNKIKVGPINSLKAISRTPSGRVRELKVNRNLTVSAKEFRQILGYNRLPSLLFQITTEETPKGKTFSFIGQGWGHGVGLCQWGAKKMAEDGAGYEKILQNYYPRAVITRSE